MAFCDSRSIAFIVCSSILVFLADARSWDLAVTIGKDVQFFASNGTSKGRVKIREAVDLAGIAYDDTSRLMFLSDTKNTNLTIFTKNLTAKEFEMQTLHTKQNRTSIIGLVYDPLSQNLFWTDAKEQAIVRLHVSPNQTEASEPVTLLKLPEKLPRGISLDACNRRLYWANSNMSNPSIESSNLDGSNRTTVISKNLYEPLSVTVDHSSGKLYWIDDEEGVYYKIERSNLDGSNRELLVHGRHQQPYYIAVDRDNIYWSDWTYSAIWSIRKNAKAGETPYEWASFHDSIRESDPKSIITRDNIGAVDCDLMLSNFIKNTATEAPELTDDENDNLVTSTEDLDSIQEPLFKCLNDGYYDSTLGKCNCKLGFDGEYCERSMCHNYCLHGECSVTSGGQPECKCGPSYQGPRCEQNKCTGLCLNDGYCSMKNDEPFCICKNSHGPRCENVYDVDEICSMFCASGLVTMRTIDTSSCSCANGTDISEQMSAYSDDLWYETMIVVLSAILGILVILVIVLSYYVNKLRRRPRIKKRFVVSKNGITPLTSRPQLPSDQCEIMIENCCNMNICETPCFEPKLRSTESHNHKKDEKNSLLDNMDGNSC